MSVEQTFRVVEVDRVKFRGLVNTYLPELWYRYFIRGLSTPWDQTVYVRESGYLFKRSKAKVILHEISHLLGLPHTTFFGVRAWHGLWRL